MTINLEQARKLQSLGVDKKAAKSWYLEDIRDIWRLELYGLYKEGCYVAKCSAYNAEELLGMLKNPLMFSIVGGYVNMQADSNGQITYLEFAKITLTEALGNKLIHDLENGIITAEEVNK